MKRNLWRSMLHVAHQLSRALCYAFSSNLHHDFRSMSHSPKIEKGKKPKTARNSPCNRSTTLEHLVRSPTVPKTTTRGAFFCGKLYEGVCELNRKNAVTQVILSQRNLFSVVTNLYILSLDCAPFVTHVKEIIQN